MPRKVLAVVQNPTANEISSPTKKLSVLRLNGDMYESTMGAFRALYHKLSPGGYCIVDDYGAVVNCRKATDDFRQQRQILEPLQVIDGSGVFGQKTELELATRSACFQRATHPDHNRTTQLIIQFHSIKSGTDIPHPKGSR